MNNYANPANRSPIIYSKKYENLLASGSGANSPVNYNAGGFASVRNGYVTNGDKENFDIMKKVKHLKAKYQNSIHDRLSKDMANNKSVQNFVVLGNKNTNGKSTKVYEKRQTSNDSKKMGKIKRLYGKSKSPSEMSQKFMQPGGNLFNCRNSPLSRSPLANLDNSGNLKDHHPKNSKGQNILMVPGYGGQRSRHHNSVKYSSSMNLSNRLKAKSSKNSKSKKKNNSYHKIPD